MGTIVVNWCFIGQASHEHGGTTMPEQKTVPRQVENRIVQKHLGSSILKPQVARINATLHTGTRNANLQVSLQGNIIAGALLACGRVVGSSLAPTPHCNLN